MPQPATATATPNLASLDAERLCAGFAALGRAATADLEIVRRSFARLGAQLRAESRNPALEAIAEACRRDAERMRRDLAGQRVNLAG